MAIDKTLERLQLTYLNQSEDAYMLHYRKVVLEAV